jgi:hypothetical protein
MKKTIALALFVAALAAVPAAFAGSTPQHARAARLAKQVRVLRHRLQNMTVARNEARAALQAAQGKSTALQGQVTSLQNQLAAIPKPLAVAVEQVRREVAWARGGTSYSYGRLVAQSAMDYAVGHVSTGAWGYLVITGGQFPSRTPDGILGAQAGLCGNASYVFAKIVQQFGLEVRRIVFDFQTPTGIPDAHTAAEVYYDGGWHYFDPTFGVIWTDANGNVMSITDARAGGATEQKDTVSFTNLIEDPWFTGDDVGFELDPATTVLTTGQDPFT